ncbi:MAG: lipopolysaccharide heptosyltransferase II [Verrucomicrobiaceae bacterium]|nr:lipopolysaccharide heptosyltransferase II [Verrucomicrobiaceae bacterium]
MSGRRSVGATLKLAGQFAVYALVRAAVGVLHLFPLGFVWRAGAAAGWLAHMAAGKYRRLAVDNLRIAFGRELPEKELRRLARRHFTSLGGNLLCGFKIPLMGEAAVARRVNVEGVEHARKVVDAGKPLLFAVSHLSCWELLTQVPSLYALGRRGSSIYQPLANPFLDAHVRRNRERLGYVLFDRTKGFAEPIKFLRTATTTLGVLVDQHAGDKGVWCPFFDRLASTTTLPALMALRCDTPLLPISIYDRAPGEWTLVIHPPVESGEENPTAEGITAALNLAIERVIRRAPHNWFWVHNRWKTPDPNFLLSSVRRGIVTPAGYDHARLQPFHLLVRSPNWLGDACMAFPAVRALKKGRPDLRLTILAPAKLRELWASLPEVDDIIVKDAGDGVLTVARRIRDKGVRYDAAILLTNSTRSTLELRLARIPRLVGYPGSLREKLLHQVVGELGKGRPPLHHARRYLHLAETCGAKADDPAVFATGSPVTDVGGPVRIALCAGAEYGPAKRWPLERFAETANAISTARPGIEWMLVGAPGEKEMGENLAARLTGRHVNLVGGTTLTQLIETLRQCRALLTNDTGTMHLAAALGVPTVAIFGSTEPLLTGPLGGRHAVIRHHVPCSPCFRRECPFGHYDCMTKVTPQQVARAVLPLV